MIICEQYWNCCNWTACDKREDLDEEGRQCSHILEVEEVVHAKWIEDSVPDWDYSINESVMTSIYECSNCHSMFDVSTPRCGYCGAHMEENEE